MIFATFGSVKFDKNTRSGVAASLYCIIFFLERSSRSKRIELSRFGSSPKRFWTQLVRKNCKSYYSHLILNLNFCYNFSVIFDDFGSETLIENTTAGLAASFYFIIFFCERSLRSRRWDLRRFESSPKRLGEQILMENKKSHHFSN